ncbi:TonB-dependent receptor domain-containing protein [Terasakiella pusilla]|uniref:TonB-dependent receptor domain-containing protein n=1 Tax=Terasakiella pusilla TaxID=64973 RepID=UPI003AA7E4E7
MSHGLFCPSFSGQNFKTGLMVGAAFVVMATAAQAQDAQQQTDQTIVFAPISIDAKADVITGGVQIEQEDLDRANPETMRDVFRQEPAVTVSSPIGISQQIHVNGVEDTNLAVDIDGARQANKTYHHIGTTIMDPGMLKAVKVETGVAPADAGPNALAGTISLETKDGRDFVAPGDNFGGFGKISFNSNTDGFTEEAAVAGRMGGLDIMAYGMTSDGHAYEDGDGNTVEGSDPAADNLLFKVGYTADNGYRVKFAAQHFDDLAVRPPRPDFDFSGGNPAPTEYRRQNYTLSFGDEKPTEMWDPKLSLAYTNTRLDMTTTMNRFNAVAHVEADIQTLNGKASNTFTTDVGKITTGLDFYNDVGKGGRSGYKGTEKASNVGAFVQARTSWTDDLRTSVGTRYDFSRLEGHDNSKNTANGASVNANIEYDITNQFMGYAGAGSTFGGFQLGEIGLARSANTYDGMEASRSTNYKVGLVYEYDKFTIDGNTYWTQINDALLLNKSNRADNATIHSRGFNISGSYKYGNGFVRAGFAANNTRINSQYLDGRSADYLGQDMGKSFNLEVAHTIDPYGLTLGTTNQLMLPDESQKGITVSGLDGYFVSNIYAEWYPEMLDGLNLRLDVKNLFDHMYSDRSNVGINSESAATGTIASFYEPGRSFILSARYDF